MAGPTGNALGATISLPIPSISYVNNRARTNRGIFVGHNSGEVTNNFYGLSREELQSRQLETDRTRLYESFSCPDTSLNIAEATDGTCQWFYKTEPFRSWNSSADSALFWVSAGPGCGKTVLCRYLLDSDAFGDSEGEIISVAHFFFSEAQEGRSTAEDALTSLIHQLLTREEGSDLLKHAIHSFRKHGNKLKSRFDDLWSILIAMASDPSSGSIYVVLDALDECEERSRRRLLEKLSSLFVSQRAPSGRLKMFCTSRRYGDIVDGFERLSDSNVFFRLDGNAFSAEISADIRIVLAEKSMDLFTERPRQVRDMIIDYLHQQQRHRTYLWLFLTLDWLRQLDKQYLKTSEVLKEMQQQPKTLNDYYEKMLTCSKNPHAARRLLQIIIASARPLSLEELNVCQALSPYIEVSDFAASEVEEDLYPLQSLRSIFENLTGLLVQVYDGKAYLLHQTAREFLISRPSETSLVTQPSWEGCVDLPPAQTHLAELTVLCLHLLHQKASAVENEADQNLLQLGNWEFLLNFHDYATWFWTMHYKDAQSRVSRLTVERAMTLCNEAQWTWQALARDWGVSWPSTPLGVAIVFGFEEPASRFSDIPSMVHHNGPGKTALMLAAEQGYEGMVKRLLDAGADPNVETKVFRKTAMHYAATAGKLRIVSLLLQRGADVNGPSGTAIHSACRAGFLEIVELMLDSGVDIDCVDEFDRPLLRNAVQHKRDAITAMLMRRGATISGFGPLAEILLAGGRKSIIRSRMELAVVPDISPTDTGARDARGVD